MVTSEQLREILKVIAKLSNNDINTGVMNTLIYKRLPNFPENEIDYKLNELASRGHHHNNIPAFGQIISYNTRRLRRSRFISKS